MSDKSYYDTSLDPISPNFDLNKFLDRSVDDIESVDDLDPIIGAYVVPKNDIQNRF